MKFINISTIYDILLFVTSSLVHFIHIENGLTINCICSITISRLRNIYLLNGIYKTVIFLSIFFCFCFCFLFDFFFLVFYEFIFFSFCLCLHDSYSNVKFNDCNWFVSTIWFSIVFKTNSVKYCVIWVYLLWRVKNCSKNVW